VQYGLNTRVSYILFDLCIINSIYIDDFLYAALVIVIIRLTSVELQTSIKQLLN